MIACVHTRKVAPFGIRHIIVGITVGAAFPDTGRHHQRQKQRQNNEMVFLHNGLNYMLIC
jgi:hypothetical protein